jgi:hypothetical protein
MRYVCFLSLFAIGCNSDRLAKLEKENQELQAQVKRQQMATSLDLQAKCGRDAKEFFERGFPPDRTTIMLHHRNHYNSSLNKCFVLVENHYRQAGSKTGSWYNNIALYDVYENSSYGKMSEWHEIAPDYTDNLHMFDCEVNGKKCTSTEEFSRAANLFMEN